MKSLYLLVDLFTVLVPLIASFHPKINFYKTWKTFFPATLLVASLFITWDAIFTHLGVWSFNSRYLTGLYIFNLPLEEMLFFLCIPFSCVFTYFCLDKFYDLKWNPKAESAFCLLMAAALLTTGLVFRDKWYTSTTMISTALICLYLRFIARVDWFGKSITTYVILLIPFIIVNGILTGSGLQEAVVNYNPLENLNIRFLTIPLEDFFYGYELIILNIYFYKMFTHRTGILRGARPIRRPI